MCVSASECTVGNITMVTISDETFPFDYDDINQFDCCLSATTVKNNLDAITQKVDQEEYLAIVLRKLREVGDAFFKLRGEVQACWQKCWLRPFY